jgi:mannitol/fructose-specific phosphotransferase system IIA component (Ntr-type)
MRQIFNHLIQLQELNFALAEQTAANPHARLEPLREAIDQLSSELPADIAARYLALQKRFPLAVVPVVRGNCSGCGIAVPAALINDLRAATQLHACPNCGRFLYFQDGVPLLAQQPAKHKGPLRAGIARFSSSELMIPRLKAKDRDAAIAELAQALADHKFAADPGILVKLALDREAMVSTAFEHGLAFPHVRNVETGGLTFALGLKPAGIKFGAPDEHLTRIIFFIVIPAAASAFYLKLLAGLVGTFGETSARDKLLECETPAQLWKILTGLTRNTVP